MIATVDSFIRIFKFYQENGLTQYFLDRGKGTTGIPDGIYDRNVGEKVYDPKTGKNKRISLNDIFKINFLRYEDTVDVYLNSLVLDKYTQLSYDTDAQTIHTAISARDQLQRYFSSVFYPGSYAFNTVDNSSFRRILLDWTSTIKTIQDSSKRLTDAYSLSSEDIDKALRGFGTSFINSYSVKSINKRKNFLLNVCDLYSIKGTPESIIKALNILGLNDIFIREGWMFKDEEDGDVKINWVPVTSQSEFNDVTHQYEDLNTDNEFITDWDWFDKKINEDSIHCDPHWMYSKEDILNIQDDKDVYLKLPSITPYFGIEFITDADKQIDGMETLFYEINKQFQKYLTNTELPSEYNLWLNEYDNKLSILQAYTGLIYSLIRLDDHLLYENFKSFLKSCEIQNLPDINGKYEYFQLIYWFYLNYKLSDKSIEQAQFNCIYDFIPIKSQDYCSYDQLLRWWLSCDYKAEESKKIKPLYISPNKLDNSPGLINLGWTAPFDYGRYGVQVYSQDRISETSDGWLEISSNNYSYQQNMNIIVSTDLADGFGADVENFRIVYYHTPANLPNVFFQPPFNLNNQLQDTFLDRTVRYNGPCIGMSYYNDNLIKNAFKNQHITDSIVNYDVISGYHRNETMTTKVRSADIDTTLRSMYSSFLKYPNLSRLYEDKWLNINNDFYNFVDWSIKDFTDTKKHDGLMYNNRNMIRTTGAIDVSKNIIGKTVSENIVHEGTILIFEGTTITEKEYQKLLENSITNINIYTENNFRKYPVNSKWNWAVDSNYLYYCYESNKWCRIPCTIIDSNGISIPDGLSYGNRFVIGNSMYVLVANNKVAKVDCETTWDVSESDILPTCTKIDPETQTTYWDGGRIKEGSKLSRDLAVAKIKDSYILELIYKDCIYSKKNSKRKEINKILKTEEIEVYKDPYNKDKGETYDYDTFLIYLYNSRLILDFTTGYIYPNYHAAKCDRKLYFKCFLSDDVSERMWVRIQPEYEWNDTKKNDVTATTIYEDWKFDRFVDPVSGDVTINSDTINSSNCNFLMPPYTLPNRYDSLRFLDGPVFTEESELLETSDSENIDSSVNYVLVRGKIPTVYRRVISMNNLYTGYLSKWEQCTDNHIYDCNYGIGVDLLEFIESRYALDEQYYISIVNDLTEVINDYMMEVLGIDGAMLDLTIANWSSSGIVQKTINFYKPKRARMLFTSNIIEGDYGVGNNLDSLGISDQDFNYYDLAQYRFGNPNFDRKNLNKMNRVKVSHVIHEYVPQSDTIFALPDDHNQVYSSREIYDKDSKIPSLEVYDQLLNINQQVQKDIPASFYVDDLNIRNSHGEIVDTRSNGFYYKMPDEDIYTNNIYFFQKTTFLYVIVDQYHKSRIITEDRWALFKTDQEKFDHSTCYYVANKETRDPYRDVSDRDDPTVKYAIRDAENHPRYIDELDYSHGNFVCEGSVKTNRRVLEPVFYISQFDDGHCNGFYYQDSILHPDRNNKPVYFNNSGKIISYMEPDWIIPFSYKKNVYDVDDNWRLTSENDFYNGKTLTETTRIVDGETISGYGYYNELGKLELFLTWDKKISKWIFADFYNLCKVELDGDKKIAECTFEIKDSTVNIERYQRTNRFWIVSDDKEILDFSEAKYFAYAYLNDETIWNPRNSDITKVFHSSIDDSKDTLTWGIETSCLYDNEDLIDPVNGYFKTLKDNYSIYRRNHFNDIEMKYKPISYLYCYNQNIRNFYNDDNRIKIETNSKKYSLDKEGNPSGSIEIHNDTYLKYTNEGLNDKSEWSIAFRMLAFDQKSIDSLIGFEKDLVKPNDWFMVTMTSVIDYDYYLKFAFDSIKKTSYNEINSFISNPKNTLIKQILDLKYEATKNIYQFANQMCENVYGGDKTYEKNMGKHFETISSYSEVSLHRFDTEKLTQIRDSLVDELISSISTIDQVDIVMFESALHHALIYSGVIKDDRILNCDYYNFYINGKLIKNDLSGKQYFNGLTKESLYISGVNVKISEYGLWEYAINDWYVGIITKFRILRSRPEPSKSKTGTSKNNYRPIFVLDQPRIVYPIQHRALPENITGDRFIKYNADPANVGDLYNCEENPLWSHELSFDENDNLFVKDNCESNYVRHVVNSGKTLISDSNYKIDTDQLPYWWIRKESEYRSGPIHHKPIYIAIKEKIDECYPKINHGFEDKPGNYHDIGIHFDGVNNKDTSLYDGEKIDVKENKDKTYFDITFDPNSSFTSEYDKYVLTDHNRRDIINYARNKPVTIEEDEDKVSIYKIARNFYPIYHGDRISDLRLRFIDIDNTGSKYDENKIDDTSIIVPDTAQLVLTDDAMSNGIFHNNLKFYTDNSEYSSLCGTWTPVNEVASWKDGDFNWCYRNEEGLEAVLTYQRRSGYFWWEIRQKIDGLWNTIARTYVHTKHNKSKKLEWRDYINWNQIDLASQLICKFNEDDYDNFANKEWHLIDQEIIETTRRFTCGCWIKFSLSEITNKDYFEPKTNRNIYFDGVYLYFLDKVSNKWFRSTQKCETDWVDGIFDVNDVEHDDVECVTNESDYPEERIRNTFISDKNGVSGKPRTPSGFMYKNGYLYFYVDIDDRWIRLPINNAISDDIRWSKHYKTWEFYKSRKTMNGYMNVIDSSDTTICDCFDNCYVIPNNIDIIETYSKLVMFNGISDFDWSKHTDEDILYPKSVNNDISICRCSLKDSVYIYVYQINEDGTRKLLDKLEASVVRTNKELVKPDQAPRRYGPSLIKTENDEIIDPYIKDYRSIWNYFEFPLYREHGNRHVLGNVWSSSSSDL